MRLIGRQIAKIDNMDFKIESYPLEDPSSEVLILALNELSKADFKLSPSVLYDKFFTNSVLVCPATPEK